MNLLHAIFGVRRPRHVPVLTYWGQPREPKGYRLVQGSGKHPTACVCKTDWRTGNVDRSTCPIHGPVSSGAMFEVIR